MSSFVKLVAAFAPWIAFLVIARETVQRVEIGLVAGLLLSVVMGALRVTRGVIMWGSLAFFGGATVAILVFHSAWTMHHLGVLANGALAVGAWATVLLRRPFTLDYARAQTDPARWNDPAFLRVNYLLTVVWAVAFTVNTAIAWLLMRPILRPEWFGHALSYLVLLAVITFTSWYPAYLRRRAGEQPQPTSP